ncbi:ROK family protein [Oceanobacillus sp. CFH 90083]|uniref:ROK family protein n=1 Tax=Oceanobacillus sp. CFH 90083 TaxID=2592336 RepID=UPI00128BB639|nr:ROK family protein [Oceanobacillus sp. CFH 90083]
MKKAIYVSIRKALLELESSTKAELSEYLKISFPTISKFLTQMEKEGEILSAGLDHSSGGRRAKRYKYNPDHMSGLAIFLEKQEINYIVFNCYGELKDEGTYPDIVDVNSLTACMKEIISQYPKISSLSIGVPGSVDSKQIFHIPGYEHLQNVDLKGYLEDYFSIPVVVENDMNAAVLGYHHAMKFKEKKSLVYLYLGKNGPGAGIIVNNSVVHGSTNFSGEVSFIPQYNDRNFWQTFIKKKELDQLPVHEEEMIDVISRLIASFVAIINPHMIIFCNEEADQKTLHQIAQCSSRYVPSEHIPELTISDWKQDYLYGLQTIGLDLMIKKTI